MSAWLHLRADILQEFYEQHLLGGSVGFRMEAAIAAFVEARELRRERTSAKRGQSSNERRDFRRKVVRREARYRKIKSENPRCEACNGEIPVNYTGRLRARFCSRKCNKRSAEARRRARLAATLPQRTDHLSEVGRKAAAARWARVRAQNNNSGAIPDQEQE